MNVKGFVKRQLTKREDKRYERLLRDRRTTYGQWVQALEAQAEENLVEHDPMMGGSKEAQPIGRPSQEPDKPNTAIKPIREREAGGHRAGGEQYPTVDEFVIIHRGKGAFSAGMLFFVKTYLRQHPEAMLLYGDEDVWDRGGNLGQENLRQENLGQEDPERRRLPWFKPDWSPDLLESCFYFGSVVILRREFFIRAVGEEEGQECPEAFGKGAGEADGRGSWRTPGFLELCRQGDSVYCLGGFPWNPLQEALIYKVGNWDAYERWVHFCVHLAGGFEKDSKSVAHIPRILFHCESEEAQRFFLTRSAFLKEREEALLEDFRCRSQSDDIAVSVVIPSKDQPDILEKCIRGCIGQGALGLEVIVVDNGSSQENRKRIQELLRKAEASCRRVLYLYHPQEFHFSRMCNLGAAQARGRLLLFLNDDVELCQPGCLLRLAALAHRSHTGAVGLKLYYPDSCRIQHAGVTNLPMGPVHKLQFLEDDREYYYGANRMRRNVLAVTAACLMVERKKYLEAGGFAEELRVAFNDVDFCFRLYELGYHNVCVCDGHGYHHESLSRGGDDSPEKLERLLGEREVLYERHPALEGEDPYYSRFLSREGLDTGIRPAFLTAGNRVQRVSEKLISEKIGKTKILSSKKYRRDDCLMVRVEDCRKRRILGYGVVLGDDNACYGRQLLLAGGGAEAGSEDLAGAKSLQADGQAVYAIELKGQYRPDLEENMADQLHVALGGFDVEIGQDAVPEGRYRLGMAARNRVTGLRLVNWSNRYVEL